MQYGDVVGALCGFGDKIKTQNCNIYTINEVIIQIQVAMNNNFDI